MGIKRSHYNDTFKKQIVDLINNGKSPSEVVKEYKISRSTVHKWTHDYNSSKSFKAKDNHSDLENELITVRKELALAQMENDILKQAALILGRK